MAKNKRTSKAESKDQDKNMPEQGSQDNAGASAGNGYGDPEAARQERQQENGNKKGVCVTYDGKYYQVKNDGDHALLYESEDVEATIDFAKKIAEEHNVEMVIDNRVKEQQRKAKEEAEKDKEGDRNRTRADDAESREGKRFRENREAEEGPRNILVEEEGRYFVVRNEGDRAMLYESTDKEATIQFARKVAQDHEIDLVVIDRDGRVVLEEKYSKSDGSHNDYNAGDDVRKEEK